MLIDYNKIPVLIKKIFKNKKGISVVELLVVAVIMAIGLVALFNAVTSSLKTSRLMKENDQAKELAQEALEAVRSFRDGTDWETDGLGTLNLYDPLDPLDPTSFYHPETIDDPPKWNLASGEETMIMGIFTRKVIFESVSRDPTSKNIESVYNPDPAHADPNTRKVTATVSWQGKTMEISTLLTNWK